MLGTHSCDLSQSKVNRVESAGTNVPETRHHDPEASPSGGAEDAPGPHPRTVTTGVKPCLPGKLIGDPVLRLFTGGGPKAASAWHVPPSTLAGGGGVQNKPFVCTVSLLTSPRNGGDPPEIWDPRGQPRASLVNGPLRGVSGPPCRLFCTVSSAST